jgi:uncharacterized OB-fold protein
MSSNDFSKTAYHQHLNEHKLMGSRCTDCGKLYLPPRPMCTECYSQDITWVEMPVEGKLIAFTTIHIAPTAMIEAGYGRDNPYCSGLVELENGLTISAQILGVDASNPDEIKIGTKLRAAYIDRGEGDDRQTFLVFQAE